MKQNSITKDENEQSTPAFAKLLDNPGHTDPSPKR